MSLPSSIAVSLLAALHIYIMILEMFLWTTPRAHRAFSLTPAFALQTQTLAANQGLYNGFLAAGLIWGLGHPDPEVGKQVCLFFLNCVLVAGLYGGATVGRKIVLVQAVPAVVAIATVLVFA